MTPKTITYGSKKKPWWLCENGHEWQAVVFNRACANAGCPYCYGARPRVWNGPNSLASENPELAAQWHPTKNAGLTPQQVAINSNKRVWWLCENGHEWQAMVKSRQVGTECPICKNRKILAGENDLATTHPSVAAQWHPVKNGSLTPRDLFAGTERKVWWICEKKHEWRASVCLRTSKGNGCPVCAGKVVISGENDMACLYPDVAQEWHPLKNDSLRPDQVSPYSNKAAWWICEKRHEYKAAVASRTMHGSGCPYCIGKKVLAGFNDLATLEPVIASQWHPILNGELKPDMVTTGSRKKVWWECPNGHVWKAVVYSRATNQRTGCPVCAGKVKESQMERYRSIITD